VIVVRKDRREAAPRRRRPANRLGLDYRKPLPRPAKPGIMDVHSHVRVSRTTDAFFEAAGLYGIKRVISMSPIEDVEPLRARYGDRLAFIAVPRWRELDSSAAFRERWLADLETFRGYGARLMKFWMAPPMRGQYGLTLDHEYLRPVIQRGLDLGYDFMVHVGDPDEWFQPGGPYADAKQFGTKADQFPQLEWFLDRVAPRSVIGAHMGGRIEDPRFLNDLLARHANFHIDTSATKWIVRGVAAQPAAVRDLFLARPDRLLFGSDLATAEQYDFEHYASRYWAQRTMWETTYDGESPIDDPDAPAAPLLKGINLPAEVLRKVYWENAARLGLAVEVHPLAGTARQSR
jgi:predicted TIM-barrel fold metal-dependent hydrolase